MLFILKQNLNSDKSWILAAGVVIGTAGLKLLTSKEAKKSYVHMAAAGPRLEPLW